MLSRSLGQRKAVVLFSEGLDYELQMSAAQTASGLTTMTNPDAPMLLRELEQVIRASARANVSVYGVDPRGLAATGDDLIEVTSLPQNPLLGLTPPRSITKSGRRRTRLRALSDETGGFAAVDSNDLAGAFERVVADNSTYYLLGYNSTNPKQDGKFRKIEVRVTRPGVRVRARSGYTAAPPRKVETRLLTEAIEPSPALREALNNPLPVAGLPLRAFVAPFRGESGPSVLVSLEVDARQFRFEQKDGLFVDTLEVAIVALDEQAKFKTGDRHRIELAAEAIDPRGGSGRRPQTVVPSQPSAGAISGARGRTRVRVGSSRQRVHDLEVPVAFDRAQLSISGLVLTTARAAAVPTARPMPCFRRSCRRPRRRRGAFSPRRHNYRILRGIWAGGLPLGRGRRRRPCAAPTGRPGSDPRPSGQGGVAGDVSRFLVPGRPARTCLRATTRCRSKRGSGALRIACTAARSHSRSPAPAGR